MNENEFQPGDKVQYIGTVVSVEPIGTVEVKGSDNSFNHIWPANLSLVERPEPTRTFELTRSQVDALAGIRWDSDTTLLHGAMLKKFDDEESN